MREEIETYWGKEANKTCYVRAISEIEGYIRELNERYEKEYHIGFIRHVESRIKSVDSICAKMDRKCYELTVEQMLAKIKDLVELTDEHTQQIASINEEMKTVYTKLGVVKYDAFKEIGGKLSFVLVLLTEDNNGFIINSMHSTKDGCYTYAKEVVNGEAFVILSEEEQQALEEAKANKPLHKIED